MPKHFIKVIEAQRNWTIERNGVGVGDSIQAAWTCVCQRWLSFVLRMWVDKEECSTLRIRNISSLMVTSHCNTGERDENRVRTRACRRICGREEAVWANGVREQSQVSGFTTSSSGSVCPYRNRLKLQQQTVLKDVEGRNTPKISAQILISSTPKSTHD